MALSYRSQTFQDTLNEIQEKLDSGEISTSKQIDSFIRSKKGLNAADFYEANEKYIQSDDEDLRARTTFIGRTAGRAIGDIGSGLVTFGDMVLPETVTAAVSVAASNFGESVPESFKEVASEIFDPYHGETGLGVGEQVVGTIGSFIIPGAGLIKGASYVGKTARAMSPGTRAITTKTARKLGPKKRRLAQSAGKGTAYAAGATAVAPEDNIANFLIETFPESKKYLNRLAANKDDSEAEQVVKTLISNLGLGVVISPFAIAAAYKKPIGKAATAAFQPLSKVKKFFPNIKMPALLSSRFGADDTILALNVAKSQAGEAALKRAEGLAMDLKETVAKEYGATPADNVIDTINKALKASDVGERNFALSSLKGGTRDLVLQMRQNIDELSEELGEDAIKGTPLAAAINKNLGAYLTRSYNLFDDPEYARSIKKKYDKFLEDGTDEKGLFANALRELEEAGAENPKLALQELISKTKANDDFSIGNVLDSLVKNQSSKMTTKSGLKKNVDLPESIREILGEVKDPYENYIKTYANLSEIVAQQRYGKDVADHLLANNLAKRSADVVDPRGMVALENTQTDRMGMIFGGKGTGQLTNALEDLYVSPEYKRAIEEGLELTNPASGLAKAFMRAKGATQLAKTVYSPVTHGRNVMGNTFLMLANGMLPGTKLGDAARSIMPKNVVRKFLSSSNKELADKQARYLELGIINSNLNVNFVRRNLQAFDSSPEEWLQNKSLMKGAKKLNEKVLNTYQAEDDFFKIAHFEKTLDYIKKSKAKVKATDPIPSKYVGESYDKLPREMQEQLAAQRTRDLMPNYNLVPRAIKNLRGMPVGDFLSFPAEMLRVSKNLAKYSLQDITSGDAVLAREGAKRLAGMTAVGVAGDALSDFTRNINGITDRQEEALNNTVAPFEFNQDRIYLSGIEEDERGHSTVGYLNLGPIDPFSYLKTMGKGAHQMIFNNDINYGEFEKIALGTLEQAAGPFLSPSMITEAMMDIYNTDLGNETTLTGKAGLILEPAIDVFTPGFVDFINRRLEYEKSLAKNQGQFAEKDKSYAKFAEGEVDLPAFFGLRRQEHDITASTPYAVNALVGEINNAGSRLKEKLQEETLTQDDRQELLRRFMVANKEKLIGYEKLQAVLEDYEALYGDDFENKLERGISVKGSKDIPSKTFEHIGNALYFNPQTGTRTGFFEPFEFDNQDIFKIQQLQIPVDEFNNITRNLRGTAIDYDEEETEE